MLDKVRDKLAVRQASYAVAVIVVVASLISIVESIHLYSNEREKLSKTLSQQIGMASSSASRAAYHVDEIQAEVTLEGLFKFEYLEWARISTDLGEVLSERHRTVSSSYTGKLANFLFGDIVYDKQKLYAFSPEILDREKETDIIDDTFVGTIELRASSEIASEKFFDAIITLVTGLLFQFIILGVALTIVFHRSLTLPLLSYADAISKFATAPAGLQRLATPKGHQSDELGIVVERTNQLLERIDTQHQDILHREKVATLGTLLAGVSHELNNPLSILVVQSELLVETAVDAGTRERGEKIRAMANRCTVIVRRFLALARRRDIKKVSVDVGDVMREALDIMDYQFVQAGVEISVVIPDNLPLVFADKSQITQALLNLIVNAEQAVLENATDRHISIEIEFLLKDSTLKISIADNGPGMPPAVLEQVFEPFYTTKREGQGTGLGLSYARDVARDHHGDLTAAINHEGGAVFILTLPILEETSSRVN